MKSAHAILLALVVWMLPSLAHANAVEDIQVSSDQDDMVIALRTRDAAGLPVVRVAKGMVRLWLEGVTEQPSLRRRVEGQELSYVEVRPGTNDTAAVRIRLAGRKQLPLSAVRVANEDKMLTIRIARALLTSASAASIPSTAKADEEKFAAAPAAAHNQPASAAAAAPSSAAFATKPKPLTPAKFAPENKASMAALLGLSALLGLIYLGMRILQRKRPKLTTSPIEIIATKRLGPRHQLLIVRAFGRDHLLSVQGGTTTRIAGAKAGQLIGAEEASTSGTFDFEPEAAPEQPAFGADFLRLAIGQRLQEQQKVDEAAARAPTRPVASDAVSGLMRLRREAGL